MDPLKGATSDDNSVDAGAMVTFAWRPSSCLDKGEVLNHVQLAGNFTGWRPINMIPPPCTKPRSLSTSSTSSDYVAFGECQPKSNLNQLGYWTLQRFLAPGSYEYKYVVTSTNEVDGKENVVWLHDCGKESKPDGMGSMGRNNVLHVEDYHKGKGGSMSLSRTTSRDDNASEEPETSDEESEESEGIGIIQTDEISGDGWVILSRKPFTPVQEDASVRLRKTSSDSDHTEKLSKRSSESSIEIISTPESLSISKEYHIVDTEVNKREGSSRVSTTTPARSPGCDIERKFVAPSDYHDRLTSLGFMPVKHFRDEILDDCYYDFFQSKVLANVRDEMDVESMNKEYLLLSNDHWLRQRNGDWELKYPVHSKYSSPSSSNWDVANTSSAQNKSSISKMTLYHETTCPDDITSKLKLITPSMINDGDNLNQLLASGMLRPLAKLRTSRNYFKLDNNRLSNETEKKPSVYCDVNIIIEMTSWGCLIGEIEVIVESQNEVAVAAAEIDRLAEILGFKPLQLACMTSNFSKNDL